MDLFKPLYKAHRRVAFDSLDGVFDPHAEHDKIGDYELHHEVYKCGSQWTCTQLPGLQILTNVLTIDQQKQLIKESVVDFLVIPEHLTNLDAHYELERPIHMFAEGPVPASSLPTGREAGKLVRDKLRWVTLGGQYNWTTKVYPSFEPGTPGCPFFPQSETAEVSASLGMRPEAAIVNYYSEGDILSPHQDVAELTQKDLVSISLGCACIFYIGLHRHDQTPLPVLLRSGDTIVMGKDARFAFHGVGRVFGNTCPSELLENAVSDPNYSDWMGGHRININVRQMR